MRTASIVFLACAVMAGCNPHPEAVPHPVSDPCGLAGWRLRHFEALMDVPTPADSLDAKLDTMVHAARIVPRPRGFVPGYEALIHVATVIDTTGRVEHAEAGAMQLRRTSASEPEPSGLRHTFRLSALDVVMALRFAPPTHQGKAATVLACIPVSFGESGR